MSETEHQWKRSHRRPIFQDVSQVSQSFFAYKCSKLAFAKYQLNHHDGYANGSDCDEVLAIIKELEKQEKERIKQEEEKQYEEKSSSSPPAKNLRDFLYNLVPEDLKWRIIEDPDSKEGQTVIIYNPEVSSSAERWGSENYGCEVTPLGDLNDELKMGEPKKEDFEEVEKLLLFEKAGIEAKRMWLLVLTID